MANNQWISTTLAAQELGVSPKYLRENRLKLFKAGRHYRVLNPTACRPTYRWNSDRCAALLDKATKVAAKIETSQQATAQNSSGQWPYIPDVKSCEID